MTLLVVLLAIAVGVLGVIVFGLLRTHAEILRALDRAGVALDGDERPASALPAAGPDRPGDDASDVVGTVPGGGPVKVSVGGRHHTLLAFLSSGCRTCATFWDEFAAPGLELPGDDTRLVIVAQDPQHDSESRLAELAPAGVRTVCSTQAWESYDVPGSPYFALVDGSSRRVVGSGSATTWAQVRGLLTQALGDERLGSVDAALAEAGIGPGHPSLHPEPDEEAWR